jgi:asparagine synthase (glutamine-hydrolysing)
MCGICGVVDFGGAADPKTLRNGVSDMVGRLAHRGPDGAGIAGEDGAVLGATRLAIRGLDDGAQPFTDSASGIIVVCNGEIDNHLALREWLANRGRKVEHATDVAVIPALYLEVGERFAEMLVGAFAAAVWDPRQGKLILTRDRAGERPLYYGRSGQQWVFASELAALARSGLVDTQVQKQAVAAYLRSGYFPGAESPLEPIRFVGPAEMVSITGGELSTRRYWKWAPGQAVKAPASEDEFDRLFRDAVLRQSEVDVDFGIFLSGGVDSSLVAAVTRKLRPAKRLKAYSLRFSETSYDEGDVAEQVAKSLEVDFIPIWVRPEDFPPMLGELIGLTGLPLADPAWIPSTLLAQRARQDIRVALVGEGADELFGGYPTYIGAQIAERYARLPGPVRALFRTAVEKWPASDKKVTLSFLLKRFVQGDELDGLERHRVWVSSIAPHLLERLGVRQELDAVPTGTGGNLLDRVQAFDLENSLAEGLLTKADRSGMSQGLELRAPFLDQGVMEFAATLAGSERAKGVSTKIFLKRYALRYLPSSVVYRRKRGLSVPLSSWLRGPLSAWAESILAAGDLETAGIRTAAALALLREHRERRGDHARALWTLIVLCEWLRWQKAGEVGRA